jgi:ABC-type antimicrobial peptide transport system permease subunit
MREGLALTAAGLVVGLAASAALGRLLGGLLYDTAPIDPAVTALLVGLMTLAALVACYLPARRAMRIEPTVALRAE